MSETIRKIQKELFEMQDLKYRDFHSKLMPTVDKEKVIGVRIPQLRKYASSFLKLSSREEINEFMHTLPHQYYEEDNLHAFIIEKIKDYEECINALNAFLTYIDNWATCDMMNPKVLKKEPERLLEQVKVWMKAKETYVVRFAMGCLMNYYLEENFTTECADLVAEVQSDEYYIQMMQTWYFATALAKQYDAVLPYLLEHRLSMWVHNMTIQKAVESYRITTEQKEYLKTLKRKG